MTAAPPAFAELITTSNFSFLTGASHPEELVEQACTLGLPALAITDRNTLAGVVRAWSALKELKNETIERAAPNITGRDVRAHAATHAAKVRSHTRIDPSSRQVMQDGPLVADGAGGSAPLEPEGLNSPRGISVKMKGSEAPPSPLQRSKYPGGEAAGEGAAPPEDPAQPGHAQPEGGRAAFPKLIVGSRLVFVDSAIEVVALPVDKPAYARLSRLLTAGKRRAEKGECTLYLKDLEEWGRGLVLIACPPDPLSKGTRWPEVKRLAARFPGWVNLAARPLYDGQDAARIATYARAARRLSVPMLASNDPIMHRAARRQMADVLTAIRTHRKVEELGQDALPNAERRLKGAAEMARIFKAYPAALKRSIEIADRCAFDLSELAYTYPTENHGEPPQQRLERLVAEGMAYRYPRGVPERVAAMTEKELRLVGRLGYAPYFLTVHDIVQFARSKGILCQGRGSAANSVICYALGITEVGPETITMVFERFVSEARAEPPDIDVDFEHERREEVIQHIYTTYGRERSGLCATVIHFRSRAAIREVGKVMGLSGDVVAAISGSIWGWSDEPIDDARLRSLGLDPSDRRLRQTLRLIGEIIGFPRHLSQHVGGFIMTQDRLDELCPIENAAMEDRTVIEWDKDDIDALGILKVDVLALGMLTCLQKGFALMEQHMGEVVTLENMPKEDSRVYDMLCRADAIGVFQVESRAQINFLPRMRPRCFYDLVIEVAIVRPGPIQGDMVHPYLRRRQGKEPVSFPSADLEHVLGKTLGVPLFQEQAMQLAIVAADYTPDEADKLRRSLATFRKMGTIGEHRDRFVNGMLKNGYERDFAERAFSQIEGFGEYGFPESHAASFALLVYASAWMKCFQPAVFACAVLNAQPMGFYAPAQIVRDAREHGVEIRPVCVNRSEWDNTLEKRADGSFALRLGFRQIKGMKEEDAGWIVAARGNGYPDPESVWRRAGVRPAGLEKLAEADAFADQGLARRAALWAVKAIKGEKPLALFGGDGEGLFEPQVSLPPMTLGEEVVEDYVTLRLSLRAHPMELLRPEMAPLTTCFETQSVPPNHRASVCGLVITRQRPGTASGVIFLTLEDETGVVNVVVWPTVYKQFRAAVVAGRLVRVTGRIQREDKVTHLIAQSIEDVSGMLATLSSDPREIDPTDGNSDEARRPVPTRPPNKPGRSVRHPREQAKILFPSRDFH